jgi:hypothetical protein
VLTRQVLPVYIDNKTIVTKYMREARWVLKNSEGEVLAAVELSVTQEGRVPEIL